MLAFGANFILHLVCRFCFFFRASSSSPPPLPPSACTNARAPSAPMQLCSRPRVTSERLPPAASAAVVALGTGMRMPLAGTCEGKVVGLDYAAKLSYVSAT